MTISKIHKFEDGSVEISELSKALSHPARLKILETLASRKTCICGELVNRIPLAQSTVSQHLKELRKTGIIDLELDGSKSVYSINRKELKSQFSKLRHMADELLNTMN